MIFNYYQQNVKNDVMMGKIQLNESSERLGIIRRAQWDEHISFVFSAKNILYNAK